MLPMRRLWAHGEALLHAASYKAKAKATMAKAAEVIPRKTESVTTAEREAT